MTDGDLSDPLCELRHDAERRVLPRLRPETLRRERSPFWPLAAAVRRQCDRSRWPLLAHVSRAGVPTRLAVAGILRRPARALDFAGLAVPRGQRRLLRCAVAGWRPDTAIQSA